MIQNLDVGILHIEPYTSISIRYAQWMILQCNAQTGVATRDNLHS